VVGPRTGAEGKRQGTFSRVGFGAPDPRCPGQTRVMFKFRQLDDLFHSLKTVKGLLLLVPPRTPRNSGYDVYAHEPSQVELSRPSSFANCRGNISLFTESHENHGSSLNYFFFHVSVHTVFCASYGDIRKFQVDFGNPGGGGS